MPAPFAEKPEELFIPLNTASVEGEVMIFLLGHCDLLGHSDSSISFFTDFRQLTKLWL